MRENPGARPPWARSLPGAMLERPMSSAPKEASSSRPLGGLFKHSAIYSAAPFLRQIISVGMTRFYTGWLGSAGFGVKEIVDFWLIALQQLLGQNILGGMMRFYFDHKDEDSRARVVTSCTILVGALAWAVCLPLVFFTDQLAPLMIGGREIGPIELSQALKLALLLVPFQLSTVSGFYYLMILKRSGLFTTIQTGKLLFEVGMNFWLIGALGWGVRGFLTSMLIGEALTSLFLTGWMLYTLRPRLDFKVLRPILLYSAPLIPVGFCQMALHMIDRQLISHLTDQAVAQSLTGIYGLGYKISYLVQAMIISPFMQVWHPFIFGVEDPDERSKLVSRVSTYCVLSVGAASLGLILFGRQAAIILSSDAAFWEAYKVIPFISCGYVFWALYHVSQMPLLIAKRTGRLFGINALAVLVNVVGNWFLIPRYGFVGAGIMTCATFAFLSLCGMIASYSEAHVNFEFKRLAGIVLCVMLGGAAALWVDTLDAENTISIVASLGAKLATFGILIGLLWAFVLEREERRNFLAWIAAKRGRAPAEGDQGGE